MAFLWILNLADGAHSLLDIAERADLPFAVVADAAALLRERGLLVGNGSGRCLKIESRDLRQVHPLNHQR
jgi:hypothetical protein